MLSNAVRWLHLSDIHAGKDPVPQETMYSRIVKRVHDRIINTGFVPDLLFITGDVANSGADQEYQLFNSALLVPLIAAIGGGIAERTFIVPGNHDIKREVRSAFDIARLSAPGSAFFNLSTRGRAEREILIPRFESFRKFASPNGIDWIDSTTGCFFKHVELERTTTSVGVALLNTAWLSRDEHDEFSLVASANMAEEALLQLPNVGLRFVLGHHPISWLTGDDERIIRSLFAEHRVIYLHGHLHEATVLQSPLDQDAGWPVCVQGLAAYRANDRQSHLNGIIWGAASVDEGQMFLRPELWMAPKENAWQAGASLYPKQNEVDIQGQTWWRWPLPQNREPSRESVLNVPLHTTRYTRRTRNGRIVDEHDRRNGEEDTGATKLLRSAMTVDESLAFFDGVLLLGQSGSGKTNALDRLYTTLVWAIETNDPGLIRFKYPDWRHAPLPMPLRVDAMDFSEWLSEHAIGSSETLEIITYAAQNPGRCCPEGHRPSLEAYCRRDSLVLLVDNWETLSERDSITVWSEMQKVLAAAAKTSHKPAVIIASTLDSGPFVLPMNSWEEASGRDDIILERITVSNLDDKNRETLARQYCEFYHQEFSTFQTILETTSRFMPTPRRVMMLLDEWRDRQFPKDFDFIKDLKDIYLLRIEQEFRPVLGKNSLETIRPLAEKLLAQYLETPAENVLRFSAANGLSSLAVELFSTGILKRHLNGDYSVAKSTLQDYLIAWQLRYHLNIKDILQQLLPHQSPRREPMRYALNWISGSRRLYEVLITFIERMVEKNADLHRHATMAVADFVAEAGETFDRTDRTLLKRLDEAREDFVLLLQTDTDLPPVDRYLLGRAMSFAQDLRPGVGLDFTGSLPNFSWKIIPAGIAHLGQTPSDRALYGNTRVAPDDEPFHIEFVTSAFRMSEFAVTNEQFSAFVKDEVNGYWSQACWQGLRRPSIKWRNIPGFSNHPAINVSWDEAKAFCKWYSKMSGLDVDLPSGLLWEYAARGDSRAEVYTYGSRFTASSGVINSQEEGLPGPTAVGMFPKSVSPFGLHDMCGNVFEWCAEAHDELWPDVKLTKGGSYNHDLLRCRTALRGKKGRESQHPYLGFRVCSRGDHSAVARKHVILAGGGFAATSTAIRLLSLAIEPLEIVMVEREYDQAFGGLAYSSKTAYWEHLLNLQAGRISLYREERFDFVAWLRSADTDRSEWNQHFKEDKFHESSAVPRRIYQQYLKDRIRAAAASTTNDVCFKLICGQIVSAEDNERTVKILSASGTYLSLKCDQLILCTGNLQIKAHTILDMQRNKQGYIDDQYNARARASFRKLPPSGRVLVIGSALRAYDVVMTLRSKFSEITQKDVEITLLSRNARQHPRYSAGHSHRVVKLPVPAFVEALETGEIMQKQDFVAAVEAAFWDAFHSQELMSEPRELRSERILKAWERHVPKMLKHLEDVDVEKLIETYKSLITVHRIGVVPEIADVVAEAISQSKCRIIRGEVTAIKQRKDRRFDVVFDKSDEMETYDLVINCLGREQNYRKISDPLWRSLLGDGRARPPKPSKIGIEVDYEGLIISDTGEPSLWISAVGVMREGSEFQRLGRLGSFSFTLGPIKNQALQIAVHTLRRLRKTPLETVWAEEARALVESKSELDLVLLKDAVAKCVPMARRHANLTLANDILCEVLLANLDAITELLKFSENKLIYGVIGDYERMSQTVLARTRIADALRRAHPEPTDHVERFCKWFELYLEEISLAHLTRLDEVAPHKLKFS